MSFFRTSKSSNAPASCARIGNVPRTKIAATMRDTGFRPMSADIDRPNLTRQYRSQQSADLFSGGEVTTLASTARAKPTERSAVWWSRWRLAKPGRPEPELLAHLDSPAPLATVALPFAVSTIRDAARYRGSSCAHTRPTRQR